MLEAEIDPSGDVTVEGHHVGALQGFRFTADQAAAGEDGKAIRAAAQKALATEFETRAERFSNSGNHDIALASDGILRWIGAPIGTLASTEDALKPRVILFADEQLTGPSRDKVAARAERFVSFQIETVLKPLFDLRQAEQLTGIARGIAFRLVENFGLINRRDIADEVKSLDQESRAALRRLGVRFGAYHIFVPALVKPAPASIVTLLWALKNDGKEKLGFGDIVHMLAAGRTSVLVNGDFDTAFYGLAGFRILGRRAVRVDILERLADLIRPALSWKPGTGLRPEGGFDGNAFLVTPPMMSILGATGEDIEDILKGLGYRAEPKPAADVKARLETLDIAAREAIAKAAADRAAAAEAAAQAAAAAAQDEVAVADVNAAEGAIASADTETAVGEDVHAAEIPSENADGEPSTGDATSAEGLESPPDAVPAPGEQDEQREAAPDVQPVEDTAVPEAAAYGEATASETNTETAIAETDAALSLTEAAEGPESIAASPGASEPSAEMVEAQAAEPVAEEPKPILLWRPARNEQRQKFRHGDRNRHQRGGDQRQHGQRTDGQRSEGQRPEGQRQDGQRQDGQRDARGPGRDRPEGTQGNSSERHGKPRFDRNQHKGKPGSGHGNRQDRGDRNDHRGKDGGKPAFQGKPREERQPRFDPDSPFAKLAALRDQLKK
jgi:ATP-dependent RNA helicase SUPV3L1/SUV3